MKGDDDTFVRVDAIINEAKKVPENKSLYIGNINYYHKPLRSGKWAVTYEVLFKSLLNYLIVGYYFLSSSEAIRSASNSLLVLSPVIVKHCWETLLFNVTSFSKSSP